MHRLVRILILGTVHSDAQIEGPTETWQVEYVATKLLGVLFLFPYLLAIPIIVEGLHLEGGRQLFSILGSVVVAVAFVLIRYEMRTGRPKEVYKRLPAGMLPIIDMIDKRIRAVVFVELALIVGWVLFEMLSL